jgi:hypothetical protein
MPISVEAISTMDRDSAELSNVTEYPGIDGTYREWLAAILYTQGGLTSWQSGLLNWFVQRPHF